MLTATLAFVGLGIVSVLGIVAYMVMPGHLVTIRDSRNHVSHRIDDANNLHAIDCGQQEDPGF